MLRVKRIIAFFLLLAHCNTSMFFPVVEERDIYVNGQQQDDINSIVELIVKKLHPPTDSQNMDEDDDQPDYFQLVKTGSYYPVTPTDFSIPHFPIKTNKSTSFVNAKLIFAQQEVLTPPPDGTSTLSC